VECESAQAAGLWDIEARCGSGSSLLRLSVDVPADADITSLQFRVYPPRSAFAQLASVPISPGESAQLSYPRDFGGAPDPEAGVYIIEIRADNLNSVGTGTATAR
jgi:hypothetical protein